MDGVQYDKSGAELDRTPNEYYDAVEEKLKRRPDLYSTKITSILELIVNEKKPEIKKIEMH